MKRRELRNSIPLILKKLKELERRINRLELKKDDDDVITYGKLSNHLER